MLLEVFIVEGECCEDLQRRGGDTAFVGSSVLEVNHTVVDQLVTGSLAEEQVGSLHDVLLLWFASVDDVVDVRDADRVGTTTARHKHVCCGFVPEQPLVAEDLTIAHCLSRRQTDVACTYRHELPV